VANESPPTQESVEVSRAQTRRSQRRRTEIGWGRVLKGRNARGTVPSTNEPPTGGIAQPPFSRAGPGPCSVSAPGPSQCRSRTVSPSAESPCTSPIPSVESR
jgi:hypothetical protein